MIASLRNTIAVAIAAALALLPLRLVTTDPRFTWAGLLLVVVLQFVAGLTRHFSIRGWLPNTAQLLVLGAGAVFATWAVAGTPTREAPWRPFSDLATRAGRHIAEQPAPMAPEDATLVVLLLGVGLICIAIDVFFIAARSALLAVLPLLAGYLTSAAVLTDPVGWRSLAAVVAGWLVLLGSRTIDHDRRWPRGLTSSTLVVFRWPTFAALVARLGVPAVAVALVAGLTVPATGRPEWWPERDGGNTVQLTDPTIELNENLRRPEDRPVLSYRTDTGAALYLRSSTLTVVDAGGWGQIDMELLPGFPARVPGKGTVQPDLTTEIEIGEFNSNYLPAPYAPVRWDADGEWLYDPVSLTVLGVPRDAGDWAVDGLSYTIESLANEPNVNQIALARAGVPPDGEVASLVPEDVPAEIVELTAQVTAGAVTDGEKAVALQEFLRNPDLFSYNLAAPEGVGYDVLTNFLFNTRSGYCVHFSAAMGLMARIAGIPSRVAVGFTPGTLQDDGSWLVTSHNMHAWPELYFAGLGWVRFEPTVGVGAQPSYTELPEPGEQPTPSAEPEPTIEPTLGPENQPSTEPTVEPGPVGGGSFIDLRWLLTALGVLVLALLPGGLRGLRRQRRLGASEPTAKVRGAWAELRDSATDLGMTWPAEVTPRQLAAQPWPGLDASGRAALGRVALLIERLRYAPGLPDQVEVSDDVRLVREQWLADASGRERFLARWAPRSLVSFEQAPLDHSDRARA